jgi:hypothetical protein
MVVAVPAYGIPPVLPQLVVVVLAGSGSLWLPLVLKFSCGVHCLYLLFSFFHAALGPLGYRRSGSSMWSPKVRSFGGHTGFPALQATYWYR